MIQEAKCEACRYYAARRYLPAECRVEPATVYYASVGGSDDRGPCSAWPTVQSDDWCGRFEPQAAPSRDGAFYYPSEKHLEPAPTFSVSCGADPCELVDESFTVEVDECIHAISCRQDFNAYQRELESFNRRHGGQS